MISSLANLSFQNIRSSSIVRAAPRMRANRTSTPPSPWPQNELQKSRDRLFWYTGEFARANLDREVVEGCLLADMMVSPVRGGECEETADVGALGKWQVVAVNESPVHQGVVHLARAVCIAPPPSMTAFPFIQRCPQRLPCNAHLIQWTTHTCLCSVSGLIRCYGLDI